MNALHNIQAEQAVLGACMISPDAWDTVSEIVTESDFFRADHRSIFRTMVWLAKAGQPMDVVTLSDALEKSGEIEQTGILAYVATMAKDTPSAANAEAYAGIVKDYAVRRRLIETAGNIIQMAQDGETADEAVQAAEQAVFQIADRNQKTSGWRSYKEVMNAAVDRIEEAFHQDGHITGRPTGFIDLDNATSGLQPADLIIVAGRPSMGKSTLAMQMAEHVAIYDKLPVAVFSMEMPDSQLGMRSLASTGRIDLRTIRTGKLDDQAWPRLTSAINILAEAKVFIDDSPALTPMDVRSRVRRLAKEQGQLGLVVVDYLQLMRVPGLEKNRVQEVSEISRSLKAIAKEFNVPVIALSQLNRGLEQRPNKRPVMADLRDSGGIEQDADLILFIYRDEVYNKESQDKGTAEIIIGKQRNGPLSTVRLVFQGEYTRFENFAYSNGDGAEYGY
jgi:replicative DNA helicase